MLLGALQENLIVLLCYDAERAPIIRNIVGAELFGGHYRTVVARIYDFIDKYKKPPGDHLPDILEDKLSAENKRESNLYLDVVESVHAARKHVNAEYTMSQIETYIKRQNFRMLAVEFGKAVQKDTEESLQQAEALLASAGKTSLSVFDPGLRLSDKANVLKFLELQHTAMPTGIAELDRRGFGPTRGEMLLYVANTKAGKSWWLIQLAKAALLHRLRVCHITLEMSEHRCAQRYMQALFAVSKRKEPVQVLKFAKDNLNRITGFEEKRITPRLYFDDPKIRNKLGRRIDVWSQRALDNIIIKQFPTGSLTIPQLRAYLDNLEATERFVPDLLVLDYPDLMRLDKDNFRLALDEIYKEIRGLLISRNIAGAIVSQSHRAAAKAKQVGVENVAEAYSKIAHADTIITYTQTPQEKKLGLARLHVVGRNDQDGITIVISQSYSTGQFLVDSALMVGNYWGNIPQNQGESDD